MDLHLVSSVWREKRREEGDVEFKIDWRKDKK